jgi:hypothetical protein
LKLTRKEALELGLPYPHRKRGPDIILPGSGKSGASPAQARKAREVMLEGMAKAHGLPAPVLEYRFNQESTQPELHPKTGKPREWRFDMLFEDWLAVEIQGGIYIGGGHNRGKDMEDDYAKYNAAVRLGFSILFFTPEQIEDGSAFAYIKRVLGDDE